MLTQELVKEVLEKQGVTPYRLAKEMGVENPTVYRWKNGQREANGQHLMELLRRAGRLAAAVLIVSGVGAMNAPERAEAAQVTNAETVSALHIIRTAALHTAARIAEFVKSIKRVCNAPAAIMAV